MRRRRRFYGFVGHSAEIDTDVCWEGLHRALRVHTDSSNGPRGVTALQPWAENLRS